MIFNHYLHLEDFLYLLVSLRRRGMPSFLHLFICAFFAASVAQQKCAPGWTSGPDSCYFLMDKHGAFTDGPSHFFSQGFCQDEYSHLAEITSKEENDFLKSWLTAAINDSTEGVWVSGEDIRAVNDWSWSYSDQKMVFSDWADNPGTSGECLSMSPKFGFSWVPDDCDKRNNMKYICEQEICKQPMECFQGSCYTLHCSLHKAKLTEMYNWDDDFFSLDDGDASPAQIFCPQGSLAQIESKEENEFIMKFLSKSEDFVQTVWTAGYDEDGKWKWQGTNQAITGFTNWAPKDMFYHRYHDEGCIALSREDNWAWKDLDCDLSYPVLCEEPDPSSSG
ncbi:hypothetical protein RRG08_034578 [Elysia crispata]|uniref:C-type lectin domain-containing protein n=1 Tax=Elysia crispata TaxID=231223 RepID=A0AAE1E8M2_9GAST|nr:hypothetical protein RRG08_034578 [Elysia crispata]